MEVATRGRFARDRVAVAVMADLALLSQRGPVPLEALSRRQRVSAYSMEMLLAQLRRHKLVRFTRGREGGYALARRADEVTVAEVVLSVKEPPDRRSTFCAEGRVGDNAGKCLTQELWAGLEDVMQDVLQAVTLQDLVEQQQAAQADRAASSQPPQPPQRPAVVPLGRVELVRPAVRSRQPLSEPAALLLSESAA